MQKENYGFDTLMIHAGQIPDSDTGSIAAPIYLTTAYQFESAEYAAELFELKRPGNIYSRLTNPTESVLEARLTALEGGAGALAMASGHAAMFNTILNLAGAGDEIVSSIRIYGGAINMFGVTLKNIGITVKFVDPDDFGAWENAITDKTRALFAETIGNPCANVADIARLAEIAHRHGVPLIIDSTFTTPYLLKPIDHGADIVIHSATKYLGGHGTVMGGLVIDSGRFQFAGNKRFPQYNTPDISYHGKVFAKDFGNAGFITRLRALLLRDVGACLSPFNCFMLLQGIETLSLRMARHSENALAVAKYLEASPYVSAVYYPGLENDKYYALAKKYMPKGASGTFAFELKGGREVCTKFIDSLKLVKHVANLADVRSIATHPASTTHSQLSDEQLVKAGVAPNLVRLSIGLEDINDIIRDIDSAIAVSQK